MKPSKIVLLVAGILISLGTYGQLTAPILPKAVLENPEFLKNQKRSQRFYQSSDEAWQIIEGFDQNGFKNYSSAGTSWGYDSKPYVVDFVRNNEGRVTEKTVRTSSDTSTIYLYTLNNFGKAIKKVGFEVYNDNKDSSYFEKHVSAQINDSTFLVKKMMFEFNTQRYLRFYDPDMVHQGEFGKDKWVVKAEMKITTGDGYIQIRTDYKGPKIHSYDKTGIETEKFYFDDQKRVVKLESWEDGSPENVRRTEYEYLNGRLISKKYYSFKGEEVVKELRTLYDYLENGNMNAIEVYGDMLQRDKFEYDDQNRLIKRVSSDDKTGHKDSWVFEYE
ncbi:hypothetical protein JYT74_00405 [Crocinitomix catalasitica]|nr:hypothetical protein [Crocinitomix catalasitica]